MERKSNFLTFLSALIPGVGYMYYGLIRKGVEALGIFLLVEPLFSFIGLSSLVWLIRVPLWFYTFFDTFSIANRINAGETVLDSDFLINNNNNAFKNIKINESKWIVLIGWFLIVIGVIAVFNRVLQGTETYYIIKQYVSTCIVPAIFIVLGIYLLYRSRK